MQDKHIPGAVALQRACFPAPFPFEALWSSEHLGKHLDVFPDGQLVVLDQECVVASASNLVISEQAWQRHDSWEQTTGGFEFKNHDSTGTTLYGADISVHPEYRGRGLARQLYNARFELVRQFGLNRFGTACRFPDWHTWITEHPDQTQSEYCQAVVRGHAIDRTMTPLVRMGLTFLGVAEHHMDDPESGNSAAILEWTP